MCLLGSCFYINHIYSRWQEKPVVINYADRPTLVSEIPFPAVTICPLTKTSVNRMNITAAIEKIYKHNLADYYTANE